MIVSIYVTREARQTILQYICQGYSHISTKYTASKTDIMEWLATQVILLQLEYGTHP